MAADWRLGSIVTRWGLRLSVGANDDDDDDGGAGGRNCCRTSSPLPQFPPRRTLRLVARSLASCSGKWGTLGVWVNVGE